MTFSNRLAVVAFLLLVTTGTTSAQTRVWNNAGTSSWTVAGNWINGLPNSGVDVQINNGGTAQLASASGTASGVYLGAVGAGSSGNINISRTTVPGTLTSSAAFVGHASTIPNSTATVSGLDSSWTNSGAMIVGYQGIGILNVQTGADVLSGSGFLGDFPDGNGTANISGTGSTWINIGDLRVGNQGTGTLNISSGGKVTNTNGYVGFSNIEPNASGTVTVTGTGSEWTTNGDLGVGSEGRGTLNITGGGKVTSATASIGNATGSLGNAVVSGAGSTWNTPFLKVGNLGNGTLEILGGATVTTSGVFIGDLPTSTGTVNIAGAGSTWNNTDYFVVGLFGHATLTVQEGAIANLTSLNLGYQGTINIYGGTIVATSFYMPASGVLNFVSGTLRLTGNQTLVAESNLGKALTADPVISGGKNLVIDGIATLHMPLALDGGTLSVGQLVNPALVDLRRGTLNLTNQVVTVQAGGLFGDRLELKPDIVLNVTSGVTNHGLIEGSGRLGGPLTNAADGEIRATAGNSLSFTGATATNSGDVRLIDGLVEFASPLTNSSTGRITGRGTLSAGGAGLTNNGHIALSSGISDVFGDVVNNTGNAARGITVSGNADVTFWDDVNNVAGSLFRVSAGSTATFFGTYGGAGISGPGGNVFMEADVTPGASPAIASFGGNVNFGPASSLNIELGGISAGSQYDQLNVAGQLTLGGTLKISLINGFVPSAGQSFNFIVGSNVVGAFSAVELPSLPGLTWNTSQLVSGMLSVVAGIAGDYNHNGVVDTADYAVWRRGLGTTYTQADYGVWRAHFGQTGGSGSGASTNAAVPEPATTLLTILAAAGCCLRRRRVA